MRVSNWNPAKADPEIINACMERLVAVGELIANKARSLVRVGKSRPAYKGGKDYTAREAGATKKSIRVVRLHGDPRRNVRVYAGNRLVFWPRFLEFGTVNMRARPFLRPALNASKSEAKNILLNGV
jgi:HK97 gp10 family phage protein